MVDAKAIYLWTRAERRDEEDVSIDTSHTHSFSCLISAITCFCLSLQSAVLVVVLVAHLQLHLQLELHLSQSASRWGLQLMQLIQSIEWWYT